MRRVAEILKQFREAVGADVYDTLKSAAEGHERLAMSPSPVTTIRRPKDMWKSWDKPQGAFWYACGDAWVEFIKHHWQGKLDEYGYMYAVEINPSKVLRITNSDEFYEFHNKYLFELPELGQQHPDWGTVTREYGGIEICPWLPNVRRLVPWYSTWDIPSGAIWDQSALKELKQIAHVEDGEWVVD